MKFPAYYAASGPVISFELFPPRTETAAAELEARLPQLVALRPAFITVTYGALGSTRERTLDIATRVKKQFGMETAHHLTCVGSTPEDIDRLLERIRDTGIENIVALRGDPPRGETHFVPPPGGYSYACQLVEHIRRFGGFGIAVAGYPEKHLEAPDMESDLRHLKRKVEAGADAVITQLFYENTFYFRFVQECREMDLQVPIVPGLLPILNTEQIKRIISLCGSSIPARLAHRLEEAGPDLDRVRAVGIQHTVEQAQELLERGAPGIHFYVLNQSFHIAEIMSRIRPALRQRLDEPKQ